MPYPIRPVGERLERNKFINGECWEWTGCFTKDGYGVMGFKKVQKRVHRVSYEFYKGESAEGKQVCHTCDNPKCFNPSHLFLGTPLDNTQDMIAKGRDKRSCGEDHGSAAITEEQAIQIISQRNVQRMKLADIAEIHGISFQHVSDIARGKRWAHLQKKDAKNA